MACMGETGFHEKKKTIWEDLIEDEKFLVLTLIYMRLAVIMI
jgi:hypothetical protein